MGCNIFYNTIFDNFSHGMGVVVSLKRQITLGEETASGNELKRTVCKTKSWGFVNHLFLGAVFDSDKPD